MMLTFKDTMFLLRRHATMSLRETDPHLAEASLWDSALAKLARRLPVHLKKGPRFDPTRSRCRSSDGILAYRAASRSGISCNNQERAEQEVAGDKVCPRDAVSLDKSSLNPAVLQLAHQHLFGGLG